MSDPLTQVVSLLEPTASFTKVTEGAGAWRVRRAETGRLFYCAVIEGAVLLTVGGDTPLTLEAEDFVLIPAAFDFTVSSTVPPRPGQTDAMPIELRPGVFRLGRQEGPCEVRTLIGYCTLGSPDAALLVSLLPRLIHVRGQHRLATLVELVHEETRSERAGREAVLARLVEVLLIEALRSAPTAGAHPGLLRGLADTRLAGALRRMHEEPTAPWTVPELARAAALSRSSFFERFRQVVGVSPMEYLLHWRMALAKDFLRRREGGVAEAALRVGYGSASTFSIAFTRHVGLPPSVYARELAIA